MSVALANVLTVIASTSAGSIACLSPDRSLPSPARPSIASRSASSGGWVYRQDGYGLK